MTTGAIIAIVVVALIVIALLAFMLPRMRAKAEVQKRERELQNRRDRAAEEQRAEADCTRAPGVRGRAEGADRASARPRPSARRRSCTRSAPGLHESGMADHELIDESERDRFARHVRDATVATTATATASTTVARRHGVTTATATASTTAATTDGTLDDDYERGRRDEAIDERRAPPARFDARRRAPRRDRRDAPTRY